MGQLVANSEAERCLRECLKREGFSLSEEKGYGETGVDIIAKKNGDEIFIEVIGFKKSPPARSKDFYEVFFRAISRLKDGAEKIVIALPERFGDGLHQRAAHYGKVWKRLGDCFPELEIWLVRCDEPFSYRISKWNDWLSDNSL